MDTNFGWELWFLSALPFLLTLTVMVAGAFLLGAWLF